MKITTINVEGLKGPLHFRDGTSDAFLIKKNILSADKEYNFPPEAKPKVIFDIGANIGVTSILLAQMYPEATIYSFEPQKDNFELLTLNTSHYPNVKRFNFGLSDDHGEFNLYASTSDTNFGGHSFFKSEGVNEDKFETCKLVDVYDFLYKEGSKGETEWCPLVVDLIKIDCEGAEHSILTAFHDDTIMGVKWIFGELHGEKDFELLGFLRDQGFSLAFNKSLDNRVYPFLATR